MKKLQIILDKYLIYAIYAIAIISILGYFRGCSANKDRDLHRKEMIEVRKELDSLKVALENTVYTKEELRILMDIQGLKSSKRTLYDWNAVVRTAMRPDDRMNEYDQLIESLEKNIE